MTMAAVVVFTSETLREEQGDHEEHGHPDGQYETHQVVGVHSRSTPRSTSASRPNSARVSTTKATSLIDLHP
jgi:hypothetical protein